MKNPLLLFILVAVLFLQCQKESVKVLSNAEAVLPGIWRIESYTPELITEEIIYQNEVLQKGSPVHNIGSLVIEDFGVSFSAELRHRNADIDCVLKVGAQDLDYHINTLSEIGGVLFCQIRPNPPEGSHVIADPDEKFLQASRIFYGNYFIEIDGTNRMIFTEIGEIPHHEIVLVRS